jgi:D-alanine-D-alanine ligase
MTSGPKRRLVVLFGGRSAEHEVSVVSAHSVLAALDPERYEVVTIGIDKQGHWHRLPGLPSAKRAGELPAVGDDGEPVALSKEPGEAALVASDGGRTEVDVVLPLLHGPFGEDGTVQGMLELAGLPYVGAGVLASAVGMDKAVQKVLFVAAGLPVIDHEVVHEREWEQDRGVVQARAERVGLPAFVKPATLGSSVGITKISRWEELPAAMEEALSYARKALIERSAEGFREIECAVLGNDEPESSVPGEILPDPDAEFYDYRAKYVDEGTRLEVPAHLGEAVTARVRAMALEAFRAIDGAGMARVDFFVREPDEIVINEINTIPGFTPGSMYPKMWEATGLSYSDLIDRLVDLALERHAKETKRGRGLGSATRDGVE